MNKIYLLLCLCCSFTIAYAQNSIVLSLNTITIHPFAASNLSIHQNTIGNGGVATFEPGICMDFNRQITKNMSFAVGGKALLDRFSGQSASLYAGFSVQIFKDRRHSLNLGVGPCLFVASSRTSVLDYVNEEKFLHADIFPNYKVSYLSGFLEYDVIIDKQTAFVLALVHAQPQSLGMAAGIRFRKVGSGKGCNCPSYK